MLKNLNQNISYTVTCGGIKFNLFIILIYSFFFFTQKNGNTYNGNSNGSNGNKVHCVEAYRDLGECLQKAIMAAAQTNKKEDDYSC